MNAFSACRSSANSLWTLLMKIDAEGMRQCLSVPADARATAADPTSAPTQSPHSAGYSSRSPSVSQGWHFLHNGPWVVTNAYL